MATMTEIQTRDEVLAEVRQIKDRLAAVHGYDVHRIAEEARAEQAVSRRQILSPPPKSMDKAFEGAAARVLTKNVELIQRLA